MSSFVTISTVVGTAGSLISANQQKQAAKGAANAASATAQHSESLLQPYNQSGQVAMNRLASGMGQGGEFTTPFQFNPQSDPGYQFRMDEAMKALSSSASAKGMMGSGGALKGIAQYSQGLASQEYGNSYNRFMQDRQMQMGGLQNLANMGYGAAAGGANISMQNGQQQSNALTQYGNASSAGISGMTQGIAGGLNQYANQRQQQSMLDQYLKSGNTTQTDTPSYTSPIGFGYYREP